MVNGSQCLSFSEFLFSNGSKNKTHIVNRHTESNRCLVSINKIAIKIKKDLKGQLLLPSNRSKKNIL